MSRSLSVLQAVLLGAVVLLGAGLATGGLFAVGSRQWFGAGAFHVRAGFREVRGVEVGTRVRVQGIDAGEVVALEPPAAPGGDVVLRLRLDGRMRHLVRTDARVQIVSEGMIGGKVVEIKPGAGDAEPAVEDALLASVPSAELSDALAEVTGTLQGFRNGEGPLGKEVLGTVQQTRGTLASIQQVADAAKRLPWVRSYVKDQHALLVRSDFECNHRVFAESELFEPNGTSLTAQGKQHLDKEVSWLTGLLRHEGADLVVASYADPRSANPALAQAISDRQSEAVCQYLKNHHAVHKTGWFSKREVKSIGLGVEPALVPVKPDLPPARVEVLVFVPRK